MECLDGAKGPGVGLPIEVAQGESWNEAWLEKLIDVVRVEVLDCAEGRARVSWRQRGLEEGRGAIPVTLDVEKGCSMANS